MRIYSASGLVWLALGLVMVGASINALLADQIFFPGRGSGGVRLITTGEGALFWFVVAFYSLGGTVLTLFGAKRAFTND